MTASRAPENRLVSMVPRTMFEPGLKPFVRSAAMTTMPNARPEIASMVL